KSGVHGLEVPGKHDERIDCFIFASISERFLCAPANRAETASERKWTRGRHALNPWDSAQAIFKLTNDDGTFLRRWRKPIGLNLKSEQALSAEPRIDALQFQEAAHHESRADEEYKGEGHFDANHDLARKTASGKAFVAAAPAQDDHHVRPGCSPGGRQAKDGSRG